MVHTCNGVLLSHKNEWNITIATTWLDLEILIASDVSQTKKWQISYDNVYRQNLKSWYKWTYLQKELES